MKMLHIISFCEIKCSTKVKKAHHSYYMASLNKTPHVVLCDVTTIVAVGRELVATHMHNSATIVHAKMTLTQFAAH